jgi:hypothetical protein
MTDGLGGSTRPAFGSHSLCVSAREPAFRRLLGEKAPLSASTIVRLKATWALSCSMRAFCVSGFAFAFWTPASIEGRHRSVRS